MNGGFQRVTGHFVGLKALLDRGLDQLDRFRNEFNEPAAALGHRLFDLALREDAVDSVASHL